MYLSDSLMMSSSSPNRRYSIVWLRIGSRSLDRRADDRAQTAAQRRMLLEIAQQVRRTVGSVHRLRVLRRIGVQPRDHARIERHTRDGEEVALALEPAPRPEDRVEDGEHRGLLGG